MNHCILIILYYLTIREHTILSEPISLFLARKSKREISTPKQRTQFKASDLRDIASSNDDDGRFNANNKLIRQRGPSVIIKTSVEC